MNPMQELCKGGCGFYGSPATDGHCSLCYKERNPKKAGTSQSGVSSPTAPQPTTDQESVVGKSSAAEGSVSSDVDDKVTNKELKKKKNRCASCRKKVGLTGFECRCGGLYCSMHRYSDKHECNFNYKAMGAQEILRNNPVVVGEKVKKI